MLYVNQNKLEHMLKLVTHKEVVDTIVKMADTRIFDVVRNDVLGYTAITPKVKGIYPSLCVHTDTVGNIHPETILKMNDVWRNGDHSKLLGADDRAGCYIVKELVTRSIVTYNYLIFDQEEVGGIGSSNFARTDEGSKVDELTSFYCGLDRYGMNQQALYGYESDDFLAAIDCDYWVLADGSFTDASNLAGDFGKCCMNLSVGYENEHTRYETLNITYLAVTMNRLYNGLNDALYGTYFMADDAMGYEWDNDLPEEFYDEYVWSDEAGRYIAISDAPVFGEDYKNPSSDMLTKGM